MSLVVQTPMSSSSTSWASATATATATSPNQKPFPTTKSSLVILVFLGLGCLAALVAVVLRRRRILRRGWATRAASVESGNANIPMVMKKPKLWDLRNGGQPVWGDVTSLEPGYGDTYGQWANIMPLSAKAVSVNEASQDFHPLQVESNLSNSFLPSAWQWKASKHSKYSLPPPAPPQPSTKLQVGVAIVMPSPQYPLYVNERKRNNIYAYYEYEKCRKRYEIPNLSIGIYEGNTWKS